MATSTKSRSEATSQLADLPERVSVLETKVENINEKLIDLKADVRDMHDCLDNTRDLLDKKLCEMADTSNSQHAELADKIKDLHATKDKWVKYALAAMAFAAGTGWLNAVSFPHILKFLGL